MTQFQDMIGEAVSVLGDVFKQFVSRTITYTRPSTGQSVGLQATPGQSAFPIANSNGLGFAYESRFYLALAADLTLDGRTPAVPTYGDQITDGGTTWEVGQQDRDANLYQNFGPDNSELKIYVKAIA